MSAGKRALAALSTYAENFAAAKVLTSLPLACSSGSVLEQQHAGGEAVDEVLAADRTELTPGEEAGEGDLALPLERAGQGGEQVKKNCAECP